jgi:hypothetical protein
VLCGAGPAWRAGEEKGPVALTGARRSARRGVAKEEGEKERKEREKKGKKKRKKKKKIGKEKEKN